MSQLFINVIGHNASGKTTFSKRLETELGLSRVSGDDFRRFIRDHVRYFRDIDFSYPTDQMDRLAQIVLEFRFALTRILLEAHENVVFDGSGSTKTNRARYLREIQVSFPDVVKVIIFVSVDEAELVSRLKARDGKWLDQYHDIKKASFEPPKTEEAEHVLEYDQHNYEEIRQKLQHLLAN